jgi:hypothetical protein
MSERKTISFGANSYTRFKSNRFHVSFRSKLNLFPFQMSNHAFNPFASVSRETEAPTSDFLPPLARAKLDEFFLLVSAGFFLFGISLSGYLTLAVAVVIAGRRSRLDNWCHIWWHFP